MALVVNQLADSARACTMSIVMVVLMSLSMAVCSTFSQQLRVSDANESGSCLSCTAQQKSKTDKSSQRPPGDARDRRAESTCKL